VWGLGSGFRVPGFGFQCAKKTRFWFQGFGCRVSGLVRIWVLGFECTEPQGESSQSPSRASSFGFRAQGLQYAD